MQGGHVSFGVPPPLRNGMKLGGLHVYVSLRHGADGSATITAQCPRTLRSASVTVAPDDPTLSSIIVKHGTNAIYHTESNLVLSEEEDGKLALKWQP